MADECAGGSATGRPACERGSTGGRSMTVENLKNYKYMAIEVYFDGNKKVNIITSINKRRPYAEAG
jgi:hypothetical protein